MRIGRKERRRRPIRHEVAKALGYSLLSTVVLTAVVYLAALLMLGMLLANGTIYPANYAEEHIDEIAAWITNNPNVVTDADAQASLSALAKGYGIGVDILSPEGNDLYSTDIEPLSSSAQELLKLVNTTTNDNGTYRTYLPVLDSSGALEGVVVTSYRIEPSADGVPQGVFIAVTAGLVLTPVLILLGSLAFFSNRFWKRISAPLLLLERATQKIRDRDLDFEINYAGNNEIGDVLRSFEDMRSELKGALEEQWRLERVSSDMIQALAHDVKTPVTVIYAYSDSLTHLLEENEDSTEAREYARIIADNAQRTVNLTRRLTEASASTNVPSAQEGPFRPYKVLERVCTSHESSTPKRKVGVHLQARGLAATAEVRIANIDDERWGSIADNLIANAVDHSPEHGEVIVDLDVSDTDGLTLCVMDQGPGMTPGDEERIFERFYRGDASRGTGGSHLGLGLYIVKSFVETAHGSVRAKNGEQGAVFTVRFPDVEVLTIRQ